MLSHAARRRQRHDRGNPVESTPSHRIYESEALGSVVVDLANDRLLEVVEAKTWRPSGMTNSVAIDLGVAWQHLRARPGAVVDRATTAGREDTSRLARQCDVPHNGFTEEAITFLRECLSFSFHSTKSVIIFSEEKSHG